VLQHVCNPALRILRAESWSLFERLSPVHDDILRREVVVAGSDHHDGIDTGGAGTIRAIVDELERTFVPEIEAAAGPAPEFSSRAGYQKRAFRPN
jgi:hypothetical protein